jgi:hypothetical protein
MISFLRRLFRRREFAGWSVDHARCGYVVGDLFVARSDVVFIVAYKRDLITIDQLCLALAYGDADDHGQRSAIHIEEDNPQYKDVLADLEAHFDLRDGWWREATREPFGTDRLIIWQRPEASVSVLPN